MVFYLEKQGQSSVLLRKYKAIKVLGASHIFIMLLWALDLETHYI